MLLIVTDGSNDVCLSVCLSQSYFQAKLTKLAGVRRCCVAVQLWRPIEDAHDNNSCNAPMLYSYKLIYYDDDEIELSMHSGLRHHHHHHHFICSNMQH